MPAWFLLPAAVSAIGAAGKYMGAKARTKAIEGLKPTKDQFKAGTGYLQKYMADLRGRSASRARTELAMRPALRAVGQQQAQAQRQLSYSSAQQGLAGSGIEAQKQLSLQQAGMQQAARVGETVGLKELQDVRSLQQHREGQEMKLGMQIGAQEASAERQYQQALRGHAAQLAGAQADQTAVGWQGVADTVGSFASAYGGEMQEISGREKFADFLLANEGMNPELLKIAAQNYQEGGLVEYLKTSSGVAGKLEAEEEKRRKQYEKDLATYESEFALEEQTYKDELKRAFEAERGEENDANSKKIIMLWLGSEISKKIEGLNQELKSFTDTGITSDQTQEAQEDYLKYKRNYKPRVDVPGDDEPDTFEYWMKRQGDKYKASKRKSKRLKKKLKNQIANLGVEFDKLQSEIDAPFISTYQKMKKTPFESELTAPEEYKGLTPEDEQAVIREHLLKGMEAGVFTREGLVSGYSKHRQKKEFSDFMSTAETMDRKTFFEHPYAMNNPKSAVKIWEGIQKDKADVAKAAKKKADKWQNIVGDVDAEFLAGVDPVLATNISTILNKPENVDGMSMSDRDKIEASVRERIAKIAEETGNSDALAKALEVVQGGGTYSAAELVAMKLSESLAPESNASKEIKKLQKIMKMINDVEFIREEEAEAEIQTLTDDDAGRAIYEKLPPGATYIAPDGTTKIKK